MVRAIARRWGDDSVAPLAAPDHRERQRPQPSGHGYRSSTLETKDSYHSSTTTTTALFLHCGLLANRGPGGRGLARRYGQRLADGNPQV
jgi:hypothetical protein